MQTKDHKALAEYLIQSGGAFVPGICGKALILGSVAPDYNLVTYLRGIVVKPRFHGHNDEKTRPFVYRSLRALGEKEALTPRDFFRLGVTLHYLADSFTFPHTKAFTGTIWQHLEYEKQIDALFRGCLTDNRYLTEYRARDIVVEIARLHESCEVMRHDPESDSIIIIRVCQEAFGSVVGEKLDSNAKLTGGGLSYENSYHHGLV